MRVLVAPDPCQHLSLSVFLVLAILLSLWYYPVVLSYLFLIYLFIYLLRVSEHEWGRGRGRERGGSNPQFWNHDLGQNQESDAQPTEPPRCPYLLVLMCISLVAKMEHFFLCVLTFRIYSSVKYLVKTFFHCYLAVCVYY